MGTKSRTKYWDSKKNREVVIKSSDPMELEIKSQEELQELLGERLEYDLGIYYIAQDMLINGYEISLRDINNPGKAVSLGTAQSVEREYFNQESTNRLLKILKFPVYRIYEYSNPAKTDIPLYVSSPYGDIPSDFLGTDEVYYKINNVYYFNTWGQGAKLEDICKVAFVDQIEDEEGLTRVDFVPREEHSRVVPLGPKDYGKINKMFEDIDAGLYRYRA